MLTSHRITVLGKDLQVRTSATPEAVRVVEEFVNKKVGEVAAAVKSGDSQVIAALSLMNIAEGYLALLNENEQIKRSGREMIDRIDAGLKHDNGLLFRQPD